MIGNRGMGDGERGHCPSWMGLAAASQMSR